MRKKEREWKEGKREGKYQVSYQGVIVVPEGERKKKRKTDLENEFWRNNGKISPNLINTINSQIQKVQWIPSRINAKKTTS